jgi:predicted transcriptional regulator
MALMTRWAQDITDAELSVLKVLWDDGPATVRRIMDRLYPEGTTSQYATVQKLLERLEEKRLVSRDRSGRVHVFAARVKRDAVIDRRLRTLADNLCDGSLSPLLTHLVKAKRLSARERRELRRLLDELDRKGRS